MVKGMDNLFYERKLEDLAMLAQQSEGEKYMFTFYRYILRINISEGEQLLKLKNNTGRRLDGYQLIMKKIFWK